MVKVRRYGRGQRSWSDTVARMGPHPEMQAAFRCWEGREIAYLLKLAEATGQADTITLTQ